MDAVNADFDPARVHAATLVLDSHIDIPWPAQNGGPFAEPGRRCVDLPKMRAGGMAAGCFAAFVPQTPDRPETRAEALVRALAMLEAIRAMGGAREQGGHDEGGRDGGGRDENQARLCTTADAIEAAWRDHAQGIVPCVENGHAIAGDVANVTRLRAAGAIYMTLTHNGHNALADSAVPRGDLGDGPTRHGGLSAIGRAAIAEMNRVGMMIDIAHVSRAGMLQAAEASRTPIVSTHSCVRALCDHPRNLDDSQLDVIRDVGGVVQITTVPAFVRAGGKPETVTLSDLLDHVDHAVARMGIDHVGIGSDFDGGGGLAGWRHAGETPAVTAALLARGYDAHAIGLLWGGNFLRVLRAVEQAAG